MKSADIFFSVWYALHTKFSKKLVSWQMQMSAEFYNIWPTSRHVHDMSTTFFPTKLCQGLEILFYYICINVKVKVWYDWVWLPQNFPLSRHVPRLSPAIQRQRKVFIKPCSTWFTSKLGGKGLQLLQSTTSPMEVRVLAVTVASTTIDMSWYFPSPSGSSEK